MVWFIVMVVAVGVLLYFSGGTAEAADNRGLV